jgi:hypothetical protein
MRRGSYSSSGNNKSPPTESKGLGHSTGQSMEENAG